MINHYTVKDLKEALDKVPDDLVVLVAADEEGNSFKNVGAAQTDYALEFDDDTYEFDIVAEDDIGSEYDKDEVMKVFVIWP